MKRHSLATRLWHWINVIAVAVLFMSGLNISNAHRHLYWGDWGFQASEAWIDVVRFPGWATIPDYYSLAAARQWHLLFAWVLALGLLFYMVASLINRHFRHDIATSRREWRWPAVKADIAAHLRLDFTHGGGKYNFLQKVAYSAVLFVLLPAMILTGMAISPGINASLPVLLDLFGGRQSARTIHFLAAWGLFGFFILHVALVLLSNPLRQLREMITGGQADETA